MLSIGQLVDAGTALAWRGPMVASALGQLMDGDWGDTDTMIVDLPPGTGDIQMSLVQKYKPAGAVIVSNPQDLAPNDATTYRTRVAWGQRGAVRGIPRGHRTPKKK